VDRNGTRKVLRDATLNLETYDFRWRDPVVQDSALPGAICSSPPNWTAAAVSAHANATIVASFLRDVLMRNGIDGGGGLLVSSVNCVWKAYERPPGSRAWLNAFWDPSRQQMVYGQATFNGKLRSLASALDVVAHELFHGVTEHTARLEYHVESGALNESYSDIFGIIISNFAEPNIANWNWLMGDGISSGLAAFRDFEDPTRFDQPKHMDDFAHRPDNRDNDYGGVHKNSGIHNFATYSVITARDAGAFLFTPAELAAMFYVALTQQLSRQSTFSDSRRGVVLATRSLFRNRPQPELARRVAAVEAGFSAAGIQ
jgi:Zn-dependent metalloprotease